jgi:chorismate mutase
MNNLGKHRKIIDNLDRQIVLLLQARAEHVKKISDEKNREGIEVYDPAREAEVLRRVKKVKHKKSHRGL